MREPDKEHDDLASAVIGAAIKVHRVLSSWCLESVYEAALAVELELRDIPFAPIHAAQVMSNLKTLNLPLGLRINFNIPLHIHAIKRIVLSSPLGALGALAVQSGAPS